MAMVAWSKNPKEMRPNLNNEQRDAAIADLTKRLEVLEAELAAISAAAAPPEDHQEQQG